MKRTLLAGFLLSAAMVSAQKREELQSIQRDVAQLQEQVKQLQRSQDDKMAALQGMIQQVVDASGKASASAAALQQSVDVKMSDQQRRLAEPLANMGTKVDAMSDDFRSVATNVAELVRKMNAMDAKLADISSAIRTLATPPAPPPTVNAPSGTTPQAGGPPPGVSAETSYQSAYRDYSSGKYELALQEFASFLKDFGQTENAPAAQWYMGYIYFNNAQYDDAVKAFDAVLERYPENPKTPEALYYKAVSLMKGERRTDAGAEFKEFLKRYPRSEHVPQAHSNLKVLGLERSTTPAKKRE